MIATEAEVSVATVCELAGRKPDIVRQLVELALSGTGQPVPGPERDYVAAMRAEADAPAKLEIYAAAVMAIQGCGRPAHPGSDPGEEGLDGHEPARHAGTNLGNTPAGDALKTR